jgi:hypothetical protein
VGEFVLKDLSELEKRIVEEWEANKIADCKFQIAPACRRQGLKSLKIWNLKPAGCFHGFDHGPLYRIDQGTRGFRERGRLKEFFYLW